MFTVGRIINGLGIGALVTAIPMYQAEVSTPESRGFMVSMHVSLGLSATGGLPLTFSGRHVRNGLLSQCLDWVWCVVHLFQWLNLFVPMAVPHCVSDISEM